MLYDVKNDKKKEGFIMAKETMQSVTIRIPKELYLDYKKVLMEQGKIVTYDVRKYMNEVVENHKEGQKWA